MIKTKPLSRRRMWYNGSLSPCSTVFYPALYPAIFDFFAGGVAALKRRFFPLMLASVFLLFASGIATFIAGSWLFGLLFGLLPIVVSVAVLASLVALKAKK